MLNAFLRRPVLAYALGLAALQSSGWAFAKTCPPPSQIPTEAQATAAARDARDRGFLWTVERDGKTSHLYGTLHVGKLDWAMPGPRLRDALRRSKVLALELDISDPQVQQQLLSQIQTTQPSPLPAELLAQLRSMADTLCISWNELAPQRPEFQLTVLTLAAARYDGLDAGMGSEVVLAGLAPHLGIRVHGLESVTEQIDALTMNSPAELAEWVGTGLRDLRTEQARKLMRELARTWAESDLKRLESYADWCECMNTPSERALADRVIDQRNRTLADRMDALHAQDGPAFVAVGSLHMVGAEGLPALLKARGFTVKRVF